MKTLLVVDDEPGIRIILQMYLGRQGYRVLIAGDGPEALSIASANAGAIDLLLTDLQLPRLTGRALACEFARRYPGIPVLFMTAPGGGDEEFDSQVVTKPFVWGALIGRIEQMLAPTAERDDKV